MAAEAKHQDHLITNLLGEKCKIKMCHGKSDEIESFLGFRTSSEIVTGSRSNDLATRLTRCCGSRICGNCEQPRSERRRAAKPHDKSLPPEDRTGSSCWKSQLAVLCGAYSTVLGIHRLSPSTLLCFHSHFFGECSTRTKNIPSSDSGFLRETAALPLLCCYLCLWAAVGAVWNVKRDSSCAPGDSSRVKNTFPTVFTTSEPKSSQELGVGYIFILLNFWRRDTSRTFFSVGEIHVGDRVKISHSSLDVNENNSTESSELSLLWSVITAKYVLKGVHFFVTTVRKTQFKMAA